MNSLRKNRQLVREAALRVIGERQKFHQQTAGMRDGLDRYRPAILLGGGFVGGFLIGRKQFAQAVRSMLSIANFGFALMRSSLASMLVAATLRRDSVAGSGHDARPGTSSGLIEAVGEDAIGIRQDKQARGTRRKIGEADARTVDGSGANQ